MKAVKIACVGEFNSEVKAHVAINKTFDVLSESYGNLEYSWCDTNDITEQLLRKYNGFWIVPASPYKNLENVLLTIRYARENNISCFGSCGGFQHVIFEYCLNKKNIKNAVIAEYDDSPNMLHVINRLTCSLVEQEEEIIPVSKSKIHEAYQGKSFIGNYHCNYGINENLIAKIFDDNFVPSAKNKSGDIRAIELKEHSFFVATLFQVEREILNHRKSISPIIEKFIKSIK